MTEPSWELYHSDRFDRDAPAMRDARGTGLLEGVKAFWGKLLTEGLTDDGHQSFSRFTLRFDVGEPMFVSVSLSPTGANDTALKLRQWIQADAAALDTIAFHHSQWLRTDPANGTERFWTAAAAATSTKDLACGS